LHEVGYVEGKNIVIEYRFAHGKFERLAELAAELVRLDVDVIVAVVTQASIAAKAVTKKIPVVMLGVSDPLSSGLVTSLARPDANITGTSSMTGEVAGKWLELLKEIVPKLSRVAVLWNPDNAIFQNQMLHATKRAASVLGLQLQEIGARSSEEIDRAFEKLSKDRTDALLVMADPTLIANRARIIDLAARSRLPAIYGTPGHAEAGGLMSARHLAANTPRASPELACRSRCAPREPDRWLRPRRFPLAGVFLPKLGPGCPSAWPPWLDLRLEQFDALPIPNA
jgi:putative ABC transport system substrate-binding protein